MARLFAAVTWARSAFSREAVDRHRVGMASDAGRMPALRDGTVHRPAVAADRQKPTGRRLPLYLARRTASLEGELRTIATRALTRPVPPTMAADKQTLEQLKIHRPARPARGSRGSVTAAIVILVVGALAIAWWVRRPKGVEVETAVAQRVAATENRTLLNASGYVTARRESTASSKVTARVTEVLVEEGMHVAEGQILARVDSSNVEKNLHLAEAQLVAQRAALGETKASLEFAEHEFERTTNLAKSKVVSDSDLDRARSDVATLRARLVRQDAEIDVAEKQVALWKQQLDDTIIRAPYDGVVVSKNAQPGEMISPMSAGGGFTRTGICTIVDMNSLEVEVDVNESYINRVTAGQPVVVMLDSYPDWKIPAKVIAIIPTADREKATVKVRVGFDKLDPRILPDMSVKVAFQSAASAGDEQAAPRLLVTVPQDAVRHADDRDVVWLVRDGRLERRAVTVESTQGNITTLAAGLEGGEAVVTQGPDNLIEGTPANVKSP